MNRDFKCAVCGEEFCGDPISVNGCKLCHSCQNQPLFSIREISDYLAGFTMGRFGETKSVAEAARLNALSQIRDENDGIEASRNRRTPNR